MASLETSPTTTSSVHGLVTLSQQDGPDGPCKKHDDVSTGSDQRKSPNSSDLAKRLEVSENVSQVCCLIEGMKPDELREIASDVVQRVCKFLSDTDVDQDTVNAAEQIFSNIVNSVEPKECLIMLIEQAREQWTDAKFHSLLLPVTKVLRRSKPPLGSSLAFAVDAFTEFLSALPLSSVQNDLDRKERLLLDTDPCILRIYDTVPQFVSFLRHFVKKVSWSPFTKSTDEVDFRKQRTTLSRSLLIILDRPLGYMDLSLSTDQAKSTARVCAERCVLLMGQLHPDFVRLIVEQGESSEKSRDVSPHGLSTFAFLAFGENLSPHHIPSVFSRQFLLEVNAPLVTRMLEQTEVLPRWHAVHFCINLLNKFESDSLSMEIIESEVMRNLVLAVVKASVSAKSKDFNSSSLKILTLICGILEPTGKLQYLYAMLRIAPRVGGVVSCVVGMVASEILANIDKDNRSFFAGSDLERLLQLVFALPNGEKTDLLENSERIMSALKLLGRVLPRDPRQVNMTGIWNLIPLIEVKYFRLLFGGLELSRAHYQLEIQKLRELRRGEPTGREFVSRGTAVELSKHQQIGVIETAIQTFDMMESVAKQMMELIHSAQR